MNKKLSGVLIALFVLFILSNIPFLNPWFEVDQAEQAILVRLGNPVGGIKNAGLHTKIPLIDEVIRFDKRLLEYDAAPAEIMTQDKKAVVVDNYARWRIADPLLFYKKVKHVQGAQARLDDIVYAQLRVELGRLSLSDIISKARGDAMKSVTAKSNAIASEFGIEIKDVRIKRADLPAENENAVYERMRSERERQAKKYRSEGQEEALKIRATADKDRSIILADAYEESERTKGEGDAEALRIYAEAFGKDIEFFEFLKTLEANEKALSENTTLFLSPESEFLKYFNQSKLGK
ncbi:MAG: protease modulator HflC [Pseudomonadota bacterium]